MIIAAIIGLAVGLIVGALGAGGGILSVPVLVYLLGQTPHNAAAGSLVIVILTAIVSIIPHARAGSVHWKDGALFGVLAIAGSAAGSRLSILVDPDWLMFFFGILLACVSFLMIRKGRSQRRATGPDSRGQVAPSILQLVLAATLTGLLTGFFGVGGGFAVVPMLVMVLRFPMKEAAATSLLVMIIVSASGLVARLGTHVSIDWPIVLIFAATSMIGGLLGGPITKKVENSTLTLAFGILLVCVSAVTLAEVAAKIF